MLLIFGGSAGAHRINLAVVDAMHTLTDIAGELQIIHQTGQADFAAIKQLMILSFRAEVLPFIEKMDEAYARADLVLCRAGATTVAELTAFGKAAILVPYPYAIYDHQRWNAQALRDQGAAEMILDQELNGDLLAGRVRAYVSDRQRIAAMAAAARRWGDQKPRLESSMSATLLCVGNVRTVTGILCCTKGTEFTSLASVASA